MSTQSNQDLQTGLIFKPLYHPIPNPQT